MRSDRVWCWALCHSLPRRERLQFCVWSARWGLFRRHQTGLHLTSCLATGFGGTATLRVVGSVLAGLALGLCTNETKVFAANERHVTSLVRVKLGRTRGMAWRASGRSNTELVQNLKRVGLIQSPVVEKAFLAVDRRHFVPVGRRSEQRPTEAPAHASAQGSLSTPSSMGFPTPRNDERDEFAQNDPYEDSPQYIGYYATISAPHIQAMCAELLLPYVGRSGARILDIGSGTGYLTAILAKMGEFALQATTETSVDHRGSSETTRIEPVSTSVASPVILPRVFGVDHIRPLVEDSERNVRASNPELVAERRVVFKADDGRLGWPEHAPYDAIHVGAAADVVPRPLLEQLKPGGRMVIPVGPEGGDQKLIAIDRDEADPSKYVQKDITGVRYVPLCDLAYQWQGALNAEPEEEEKL